MRSRALLQEVPPDNIKKNPDNPRLIFREEDMVELLESIKQVGIKVPVSLFQEGSRFILIDGERRWRCAKRLNLARIPAIVQPKPTRLENLLMMFNIHNVRVDWDPMAMALKLKDVQALLAKEGQPTNAKALSAVTGVSSASVRRALDLLDLPDKYQAMLIREAEKPRSEQRIKADLFIEIYKSLHAVERHAGEVLNRVTRPQFVDAMVNKYIQGTVESVTRFRDVSKMARAELAGIEKDTVVPVLVRLVKDKEYGIDEAYEETVQVAYERRDLLTKLEGLSERLHSIGNRRGVGKELRAALGRLRHEIDRILE